MLFNICAEAKQASRPDVDDDEIVMAALIKMGLK
jgi:hypothetical protein